MNTFTKRFLLFSLLFTILFSIKGQAQQTPHKIILDQMNYLLYFPDGYETDTLRTWPLMVFLHGGGETGNDVEKVKLLGPPRMINDGYKFPFIVVSPQSPELWWKPDFVRKLVLDLQKRHRIDIDRTYLTGLSMGGFGTWQTAQAYPELFAAIVPICGGGEDYNAHSLENVPIWCFHGAKDDVIPISRSQAMVDSLRKYNHPNLKFTVYPEAGHDSWTETYNNEAIYSWMLSHKRFKYKETPISPEELEEYTGTYFSKDYEGKESPSFQVIAVNNKIKVKWNEEQYSDEYSFGGNDKFFTTPDKYDHIKFSRDENKQISGFIFRYSRYTSNSFHKK